MRTELPPEVMLVLPTGEKFERALLLYLHSLGDERTPEQETQFVEFAAKYGHPDLTIETYSEYLQLDVRGQARTKGEERQYRDLSKRFRLDGIFRAAPAVRPRRQATTSRARPRGRRAATRAGASRDGPDDHDLEPPLDVFPLSRLPRDVDAWLAA